MNNLADFGA